MGKSDKNGKKPAILPPKPFESPFAALAGLSVPATSRDPAATTTGTDDGFRPVTRAKTPMRLVLRRERKHRGGKSVIVVSGFGKRESFDEAEVMNLARQLKVRLGCGGTVEVHDTGPEIVLQGENPAPVAALLVELGFSVS